MKRHPIVKRSFNAQEDALAAGNVRPLSICFVCNELPPAPAGGIGSTVLTTALALAGHGHVVVILGVYDRDYGWALPGVKVKPIVLEGPPAARKMLQHVLIWRALHKLNAITPIDIVEWPDYEGLFVTNIPGTVDVVRNHGPSISHRLVGLIHKNPIREYAEISTLRRIPNWIGVSKWFMQEWLQITGASPHRTTVIYNPVDCNLFHPGQQAERNQNLILYAGTLNERKGIFALARAARLFFPKLPNARLLFVGREAHGPVKARILEEAGAENADRILFNDAVPQKQLAELMRSCAIFAMPSLLESFGNVWAEAMASGTPVVGSLLSAGPEIVPHNTAGLLVDPRNPAQVAEAVTTLMTSQSLRYRLGLAGRRLAQDRYSVEVTGENTMSFYRELALETSTN